TDGKWTASVLGTAEGLPKFTVEGLSVSGERIRFTLQGGQQTFSFDGKMSKEGSKIIKGSIAREGQMVPCELEATALTTLDSYEAAKDIRRNNPASPKVLNAAREVLSEAGAHKAKPEEVRGWAEKLWKAAEPFGVRWQQEMGVRTADILSKQDG